MYKFSYRPPFGNWTLAMQHDDYYVIKAAQAGYQLANPLHFTKVEYSHD